MRLLHSKRLDDGGPVRLIQIEAPGDFDALVEALKAAGPPPRPAAEAAIAVDDLLLAAVLDFLGPESLLEIGAGRPAAPLPLHLAGSCQVRGLYTDPRALAEAPAEVAPLLEAGDLLALTRRYAAQGRLFDVVCGFGVWERLHPARLDAAIAATVEVASPEAMFIHVIPALGPDRVFGEAFPSRLAENRPDLEAGRPASFLEAEDADPPLPRSGRLILAPSLWWEERFAAHGLRRCPTLERDIQRRLGPYLGRGARAFFIMRRETPQARARERRLRRHPLTAFMAWRQVHALLRAARIHERRQGREVLDWERALWLEDGLLETMLAELAAHTSLPWPLGPLKRLTRRLTDELSRRARDRLLEMLAGQGPRNLP